MTEKSLTENFDRNYACVLKNIAQSAAKVGKRAEDITLLAAVKTVSPELINYSVSKGITLIGDNRVNELKEKAPHITPGVKKHFIGHLQTNKVKDVVGKVEMIESVDSLHLAQAISKQAEKTGITVDILLEVNIAGEESKSGFSKEELETAARTIANLPNIKVKGIMAIPPAGLEEAENRKYFCEIHKLFIDIKDKNIDNISMEYLSMGMSDTYTLAIECGANLVRLGTVLYGKREYF